MTLFSPVFTEADLIALHLRELSPRRERALRHALQQRPELAAESQAIAATLAAFKDLPAPAATPELLARSWGAVRSSLQPFAPVAPSPVHAFWRMPVLASAGAGAVAAVVAGAFLLHTHQAPNTQAHDKSHPGSENVACIPSVAVPRPEPKRVDLSRRGGVEGDMLAQTPLTGNPVPRARLRFLPLAAVSAAPLHFPAFEQAPTLPTPSLVASIGASDQGASTSATEPVRINPASAPESRSATRVAGVHAATRRNGTTELQRRPRFDVTLALGGDLIAARSSANSSYSQTQSATHAVMAVGSFHHQIRPLLGYRLTLSYDRPDFQYSAASTINSRIFEAATTYVVQGPRGKRVSTSADAGGALLAFLPSEGSPALSRMYRGAGVAALNADYALGKHWGVRATYRAQVFKSPDFGYGGNNPVVPSRVTLSSEPMVGVTYRFGDRN